MLIKLRDASLSFLKGTPFEAIALKNVSFELKEGEAVGVIGPTGSGKSTLGQVISGLIKPDTGSLLVGENEVGKQLRAGEVFKQVSFLFQKPEKQLFESSVYAEVAFGPKNLGLGKDQVDKAVRNALSVVGLDFNAYKDRNPLNLSGGEMRRVGIASVVALQSQAIVVDEPTAGLDFEGKRRIIQFLQELKKVKKSFVLISHDMDEVLTVCERFVVLNKGRVLLSSKTNDVLKHIALLNDLGLFLPDEYYLAKKLMDCNYSLKSVDREEIKKAIEAKING